MPRQVEFEGVTHEFPDDFSDQDVQRALSSYGKPQAMQGAASSFAIPSVGLGAKQAISQPVDYAQRGRETMQDSPLALQKPGYFQRIQQGFASESERQRDIAQRTGGTMPLVRQGLERTGADVTGLIGQPGQSLKSAALTAGAVIPYVRALLAPYFAYQGGKMMHEAIKKGDLTPDNVQRFLLGGSMVTGATAQGAASGQRIAADMQNLGTGWDVNTFAKAQAMGFKEGLRSISHDILTKAATNAKRQLWDAHQAVSQRVGQLKNDIAASDYAAIRNGDFGPAGDPTISISDLLPKIDRLAVDFKAAGGKLPHFDAAVGAIAARGKPALTFEEASNLRSEIGDMWNKASEGTRDSAAVKELRDSISKKLADRSQELGQGEKFSAYNTLWKTLQKYEQTGALGKLLNSQYGKEFFDVLRDSKYGAELARTFSDLREFGLDKNFAQTLRAQNSTLHDYVSEQHGLNPMMGKIKSIVQHPVAGGVGFLAGRTGGGFIGSAIGAVKGAELAESIAALSAVRQRGGVPPMTGEMAEAAKVQPSGQPLQRPQQPDSADVKYVADGLTSLGYDKKAALARAIEAVRKYPGDRKAATDAAIRGDK